MNTARSNVLSPGVEWGLISERICHAGMGDIYFDQDYVSLYSDKNNQPEAFHYEEGENFLFFPYLRASLAFTGVADGYFDFETVYGYGGPLANCSEKGFLSRAWSAFGEIASELKLVAGFVRFHPLLENHKLVEESAFRVFPECQTVTLDLNKNEEDIWKGYTKDNQKRIRKNKRLGTTVSVEHGEEPLVLFSSLYHTRMEELQAHEDYYFGLDYFKALAALPDDKYRVYLAYNDGQLLGGVIALLSRRFAHCHLSATPREWLKFSPNNLLIHEMIIDLIKGDRKCIHFGGGRTADPKDSLLEFKKKFSDELLQFNIGGIILNEAIYKQLVDNWVATNPDKVERFGNRILRYRY